MNIKVITDSCADIPQEKADRLGITVVPAYIHFGTKSYRDGIDIGPEEFYQKLTTRQIPPSTSAASLGDFANAYQKAQQEADEIVCITISSKMSAMYSTALLGKETTAKQGKKVAVVDSKGLSMWQGLVAIAAAKAAAAGNSMEQVISVAHQTIAQLRGLGVLDTVKYVVKSGRLGRAAAALESFLHAKLVLALHDGKLHPIGLTRTREKGIERLQDLCQSTSHVQDIAIAYNTTPEDAQALVSYAKQISPQITPRITTIGAVLGVHTGPGALLTAIREGSLINRAVGTGTKV